MRDGHSGVVPIEFNVRDLQKIRKREILYSGAASQSLVSSALCLLATFCLLYV